MTSAFSLQNFVRLCPASFYTPDLALELGLLRTHPGFGFGTGLGCIHTERNSVPSGTQFSQETMGRRGEESGEKLPVPGWLSGGALCSEDPAEEGLDVETCGF